MTYPKPHVWLPNNVNVLNSKAHDFRETQLISTRPDIEFINSNYISFIDGVCKRFALSLPEWHSASLVDEESFTLAIGLHLYRPISLPIQLRIHDNIDILKRELNEDLTSIIFNAYLDLIIKYRAIYTLKTRKLYTFSNYLRRMIFLNIGTAIYKMLYPHRIIKENHYDMCLHNNETVIHPISRRDLGMLIGISTRGINKQLERKPELKELLLNNNYIRN